jgi:hypothetical protein
MFSSPQENSTGANYAGIKQWTQSSGNASYLYSDEAITSNN